MAPRSFARVSDLLPSVLRDLGLQKRFSERRVVEQWAGVVGPELARRTRALRCESGTLTVHVDHGAWMQELDRTFVIVRPDHYVYATAATARHAIHHLDSFAAALNAA